MAPRLGQSTAVLPRSSGTRLQQTRISGVRHRVQRIVCQATEDPKTGRVSLRIQEAVPFKTYFKVCGSTKELGAWKLDDAPAMDWNEGDVWTITIEKPVGLEVEYKLVKIPRREPIKWEGGKNRSLVVPAEEVTFDLVFDRMEAQTVLPKIEASAAATVVPVPVQPEAQAESPEAFAQAPKPEIGIAAAAEVLAPVQAPEPEQKDAVPVAEVPAAIKAAEQEEATVIELPAAEAEEPKVEEDDEDEVVALAAEEEGLLLSAIASEVVESADMLPILDAFEETVEEPSATMSTAGTPVVAASSVEDQGGPLGFLGWLNLFGGKKGP